MVLNPAALWRDFTSDLLIRSVFNKPQPTDARRRLQGADKQASGRQARRGAKRDAQQPTGCEHARKRRNAA